MVGCLLAALLGINGLQAQVYLGSQVLSTQAQVDTFPYTEVTGSLQIRGTDIVNLEGLANLHTIGAFLSVSRNPNLVHLDGLSHLVSVFGISIDGNHSLKQIDGLRNINSHNGNILIRDNYSLENLDGLSSLISVGWVDIIANSSLQNLDGLSNLQFVGGGLSVIYNSLDLPCCGLYALLFNSGVVYSIDIYQNGPSCTPADILANGPCVSDCSDLSLVFKNAENGPNYLSNPTIKPIFRLTNTGSSPIELNKISARYWFSVDDAFASVSAACVSSDAGCGTVLASVQSFSPNEPGADTYVEVGFSSGTLPPGAQINTKLRIERLDGNALNEANDYSFMGLTPNHVFNPTLALYCDGVLIQGTEPFPSANRLALKPPSSGGLLQAATIYPNPFTDGFLIEMPEVPESPLTYRLFNLLGQEIYRARSQQSVNKVALKHLNTGIYLLQIQQGENSRTVRVVKAGG